MVNLLLKFVENKKNPSEAPIAFNNKKACLVHKQADVKPQKGEYWECFLWADYDKFCLVKPFKKIEEKDVDATRKKVEQFNDDLIALEKYKKANSEIFTKIVFDTENKPYLLSSMPSKKLKEKFPDYIVRKVEDKILARPILSKEDRAEWQKNR